MLAVPIVRTNISLRIVSTQIVSDCEGEESRMLRRRWLIVALCFCAFTGCVTCQSNYDYCGPMPDEGGDFMYRKNSILGGDPSRPLGDEESDQQSDQNGEDENLPEPTPAPAPDETPAPGLDLDGGMSDEEAGMSPDEESQPQAYEEEARPRRRRRDRRGRRAEPDFNAPMARSHRQAKDVANQAGAIPIKSSVGLVSIVRKASDQSRVPSRTRRMKRHSTRYFAGASSTNSCWATIAASMKTVVLRVPSEITTVCESQPPSL